MLSGKKKVADVILANSLIHARQQLSVAWHG